MGFLRLFFLYVFGASCLSTIAQQASPDLEDHFTGVNARGDQGMGFSHEKTTTTSIYLPTGDRSK